VFAIVRLGNQQFKVKAGDFIRTPFQNNPVDSKIDIPVVAFGSEKNFTFEKSKLKASKVKAVVVRQCLGRKILVFKKKRRKGYRRTNGHRQKITELKILELCSPEAKVSRVDWKKKPRASSLDDKVKTQAKNVRKTKTTKMSHKKVKKLAKKSLKAKTTSRKKISASTVKKKV